MTRLYLIRHAEAEGNLYRRCQGQYDANLTALGRKQLAPLAERFRDIPIDTLWSSDLSRTRSTATAILKYHPELTLHTDPSLREIDVGVWEDIPWGNLKRDYSEQMEVFTNDPARWSVPGCESYEALTRRFYDAVSDIAGKNEGRTVAIVTHGLAIRSLLCRLHGIDSAHFNDLPYGDNTSVALLTADSGQLKAEWYNDASHLTDELSTFSRQAWCRKRGVWDRSDYSWFEPIDPAQEKELYLRCYENTWLQSHGNLHGFVPAVYLAAAADHARRDPRNLVKLMVKDGFAGMIELDAHRGMEDDAGWISLIYIEPEKRQMRLGIQLIGHAVSYFRRLGRRKIGLHVSQTNDNAVGFYLYNGFHIAEDVQGVGGKLWRMELDITRRVFTAE